MNFNNYQENIFSGNSEPIRKVIFMQINNAKEHDTISYQVINQSSIAVDRSDQ